MSPLQVFDSLLAARERGLLPTTLDTAGLRELAAGLRANSVFSATVADAAFLTKLKELVDAMASGTMDEATARVTLLETLRAIGYTPEGGFPSVPAGSVPPALAGTLQDLSSFRRLDLIVETQRALMTGAGQQLRGHTPERLAEFPAWELIRELSVREPRNWNGQASHAPPAKGRDPRPRWIIAGGTLRPDGRMLALKGDPIWGELGASGNFPDALDVDHPPFAFSSGMGWQEIDADEAEALGITGPDGESIADFHDVADPPRVLRGQLPRPAASAASIDPAILRRLPAERDGQRLTPSADLRRAQEKALDAAIAARNRELAARQ
jgi:hypothetical protein